MIPGVIGAVIGATLAYFGQEYAQWVRIPLSFYTIYLGYYIIKKAFRKKNAENKVKRAGWLASVGGFMDAFAGGGWGALVTGTLLSKRKNPRYVIGSVCLAEFFVVFASSVTFFIFLKHIPILDVAGLIIGGLIAAPIAAPAGGRTAHENHVPGSGHTGYPHQQFYPLESHRQNHSPALTNYPHHALLLQTGDRLLKNKSL